MVTPGSKRLLDTPNLQIWTMAGLVGALLAAVIASVSLYRAHIALADAQAEVLALNKKVEELRKESVPSPVAAAPVVGPTVITAPRR